MRRRPLLFTLVAIVGLGLGAALVLFEPWRAFTNTTVEEAAPSIPSAGPSESGSTAAATTTVLARGELITHEHETSGTVALLQLPDGSRVLRIENLKTSDGPDLKVWLTDQPVIEGTSGWRVFDDGKHVELGDLKGNLGSQNYPVPASADLKTLTSISIWCARFHVSFGAAELTAA
ncbi:DM13 domain-containing protein [Cryptosporangium minutisporangium]|uniref:DM13 domain-containing protein n=1 Tax=Cryptosporangium minutisporangium TaxID=113569 RepID=A0ABP6SVQ7_9ACTN